MLLTLFITWKLICPQRETLPLPTFLFIYSSVLAMLPLFLLPLCICHVFPVINLSLTFYPFASFLEPLEGLRMIELCFTSFPFLKYPLFTQKHIFPVSILVKAFISFSLLFPFWSEWSFIKANGDDGLSSFCKLTWVVSGWVCVCARFFKLSHSVFHLSFFVLSIWLMVNKICHWLALNC